MATELSELTPGVEVEVRTRFTATWAPGFEVVRVIDDRVQVRRCSDRAVLPVALRLEDVRRTRSPDGREREIVTAVRRRA